MKKSKDTIFAVATPPGKSAIAVVRISGTKAYKVIKTISKSMPTKTNTSTLNTIVDNHGEKIDHTITTFFKAPKSYTGEDMVELSIHGGKAVLNKLLKVLNKNKEVRYAEPGEFTKRAFENNKLDITQVEAVADLVNAETEQQRKQALNQLEGSDSLKIKEVHEQIEKLLADIEATIDFSDEELPKNMKKLILEQIKNIDTSIERIITENEKSKKIRDGYIVAIVGNTNTGKSSFINNISKRDVAIVTKEPGTTRDLLESYIDVGGYPIRFYDSAGFRKSKNKIESIGIKKTIQLAENSDVNLVFIEKYEEKKQYKKIKNKIFVQSKYDIRKKPIKNKEVIKISSKNSHGIKYLLKKINNKISQSKTSFNNSISRERHISALLKSKKHIERAKKSKNYDIIAEDIRLSLREISKIYGKTDIEHILGIIFNNFCIGK